MSAAAATASLPPPTQKLDIDDLVAALSTSHIGQQHMDIQTIRDQLAQLLYSQPQALAALNFPTPTRKRSVSVASDFSMDAEMDLDTSYVEPQQQQQQQQQPRHPSVPASSPHRSQPAYEMFAQPPQQQQYHQHPSHQAFGWNLGNAKHHAQPSHLALNFQTAASGDPAPPPSSPVLTGPLFSEYPRQSHVEVSRPF